MDRVADTQPAVSEDEVAVLARVAALALPPERLAPLTAEYNGTLDIVAEVRTVPTGNLATALATALAPFDPAWPDADPGRR